MSRRWFANAYIIATVYETRIWMEFGVVAGIIAYAVLSTIVELLDSYFRTRRELTELRQVILYSSDTELATVYGNGEI